MANNSLLVGGLAGNTGGGLLDVFNNPMLGLAAGLLSGRDPGGTFGGGLSQGLLNMQGMQHAALQGSMMKAQLEEVEREKQREEANRAGKIGLLGYEANAPSDGMGPVLPGSGLFGNSETVGLGKIIQALPDDAWGQFLGNWALQQAKPAELPNEIQELQYYQKNPELFAMAQDLKRAGATNAPVKIDLKMGESIAQQVGPIVKGTLDSAVAGTKLVDSSQRIMAAVDKGNAIVGPTANLRLKGAQIAELLGAGGKDNAEKIANTRAIIRATAEQAVSARSMLGGQAQISNAEQELITKATSGDISDLTMGELKQIAQISDKLGRQMYSLHQDRLKVMQSDPNTAGLAQYYTPPPILPEYVPPSTPEGQSGNQNIDALVNKYAQPR